jgi:hypothetical protein
MDIEIKWVAFQDEEVIKQKFWIPLCLSINIHVTIVAFAGLI